MSVTEVLRRHVKQWVVMKASVTNPYKNKWWYASVTIGYDYNAKGTTIEKAYEALVERIYTSPYIMMKLSDIKSFREIVKRKP